MILFPPGEIYNCRYFQSMVLGFGLFLPRLCKAAVRLCTWIKGTPVEQELLALTPGCLLNDYCVNRSEVSSLTTLSACANPPDRRRGDPHSARAHRSTDTKALSRHPIDPTRFSNKKGSGQEGDVWCWCPLPLLFLTPCHSVECCRGLGSGEPCRRAAVSHFTQIH